MIDHQGVMHEKDTRIYVSSSVIPIELPSHPKMATTRFGLPGISKKVTTLKHKVDHHIWPASFWFRWIIPFNFSALPELPQIRRPPVLQVVGHQVVYSCAMAQRHVSCRSIQTYTEHMNQVGSKWTQISHFWKEIPLANPQFVGIDLLSFRGRANITLMPICHFCWLWFWATQSDPC